MYAISERHVNVVINKDGPVKLRAVGNRVLVRRVHEEQQQRKGIWIPENASEKTQRVDVLSVGSGYDRGKTTPFEIKVGTRVLIAKYAGTEVKVDDEEYTIINEGDVVGTIDEKVDKPKRKPKKSAR